MCVKAAGIHDQRRAKKKDEEKLGVTVSLDYCFFGEEGEEKTEDRDMPKILVMHDDSADAIWAMQVERKGATDEVVTWIVNKLEETGHGGDHITLKSDQEESIMAVKRAVAARRPAQTPLVESQVRVSKSNPLVERAIGKWRAQFRKIKIHLESEIKMRIEQTHPMVPWMVAWASEVLVKYEVRKNGRTAYEDLTGHKVRHKIAGFGEYVHFKLATDEAHRNKFDGEWMDGYFAGVITRSGEYIIIKGQSVYKCPTMRRRSEGNAYDFKVLDDMLASYFDYIKKGAKTRTVEVSAPIAAGLQPPEPVERPYIPKRTYLRQDDFDKFGYTFGCPGCAWMQNQQGLSSAECRKRK